ncbi:3-isopropylmalate dehydratase [candidate division WOR-3 bacterium]|uniref:3-isopropylmalate dehydratase small subunit n=1 Tax=candidate division WOR-3 bacterium TaxID=2052148 RepID=A0A660SI83_UNCW3|nr:MAG: 3-isopropylmalate dehydratase [candidate division WOR-3 bacterium]
MLRGRVIKLGDNIDTDQIYPGRYLPITEPVEMAGHAFEGIISDFLQRAKGSIIVAGKNFGCGSSREQAATALKWAGIVAVVAESFARIFFRNAINQGLPAIIGHHLDRINEGDELRIDLHLGKIEDLTTGESYPGDPLPDFLLAIIEAGGLIEKLKRSLGGG